MPLRDGTQNKPFARPLGRDQAITAAVQANQARPEPPQQSHSVTKLAATGQVLMQRVGRFQ